MSQSRANTFLQMIRRAERGRLKIYLGYGPGVGKTYQMLQEAHRLKAEGIDVIVGLIETHGRADTEKLIAGLDVLPRRKVEYHGITVDEFDVDVCLARKPQVALVDELAHTNVPGSRNAKRYEDVQELLAAGIHVITTLNVQHLESLYDTVENLVGVKVRERLPDSVLADADQVINVDLSAEDLQRRLQEGKVYPRERIATAMENYFQTGNLEQLRELTMREIASQLDSRRREGKPAAGEDGNGPFAGAPDQIMVCLSSRGPNSARLLRYASRLAGRLNRNWYAVYVQTPSEAPTAIDTVTQRLLGDTLTLANQLGATVFTFKGQDVADTILRFAKEYRVGQIVIGKPGRQCWWKRLFSRATVAEQLIRSAEGVAVTVIDAKSEEPSPPPAPAPPAPVVAIPGPATPPSPPPAKQPPARAGLADLLTPRRIVVWDQPVSRQDAIQQLVAAIVTDGSGLDLQSTLDRLDEREKQGSTFLNEGVALPHARVPGITSPLIALGLPHAGISDVQTGKPVETIFLLLSPEGASNAHLHLLAAASRALQLLDLRRKLREAPSPEAAMAAIQNALQGK